MTNNFKVDSDDIRNELTQIERFLDDMDYAVGSCESKAYYTDLKALLVATNGLKNTYSFICTKWYKRAKGD